MFSIGELVIEVAVTSRTSYEDQHPDGY